MSKTMRLNLVLATVAILLQVWVYITPVYTHVTEISLDPSLKPQVLAYLDEFNDSTGVLFRKGFVNVSITLGKLAPMEMAATECQLLRCKITLADDLNWLQLPPIYLRSTLLHEIEHAYGYLHHSSDPSSVMYWSHTPLINENSVKRGLVELKKLGSW